MYEEGGGDAVGFLNWSFPLFKLFGIAVRIHWLLAVLLGIYIVQAGAEGGWTGAGIMSVTMGILLVSILFHELAHCWMAFRQHGGAESILLWPLGGLAHVHYPSTPRRQILVAGVGPLSSLLLSAACFAVLPLSGAGWDWSLLSPFESWRPHGLALWQIFVLHAARLNLLNGLFNLCVPAYPLDGGQVLFAFLSLRWGRPKAADLTAIISIPIGLALTVFGFAQHETLMVFLGLWVLYEAWQLRQLVRMDSLDGHPAFGSQDAAYNYFPEPEPYRRKGWFARWRERRAQERFRREERLEEDLQRRVDEVLEKVSRQGIGSLTPLERRVLEEASKRARDRV